MSAKPRSKRIHHDQYVQRLALAGGLPAIVVALALLWTGDYSLKLQWTLSILVVLSWLMFAISLRERVVRPLQTLANLIAALREGDYSIRARGGRLDDPLGQAMHEVNALRDPLRDQRLGALEATALLRKVMEEVDVAVLAFDEGGVLRLVNRAGERLVGQPWERMIGRQASEVGLQALLEGESHRVVDAFLAGGERARPQGRVEIRRTTFRQGGLPHQLVVVSDLTRALRDEERQAWQRLVRVLGHEINNSLAPIRSIVGSLQDLVRRSPRPEDWVEDVVRGLGVIGSRSEALGRFMTSYTRLARLPRPRLGTVEVSEWVHRAAELEKRARVEVREGPPMRIQADGDQLDQLLINLVRNAVDAALETQGGVRVEWQRTGETLELRVLDEGQGIAQSTNLFVPFYTTKADGTGIGLALSRQIAEAHGGTLTLRNRTDTRGAEARLMLPIAAGSPPPLSKTVRREKPEMRVSSVTWLVPALAASVLACAGQSAPERVSPAEASIGCVGGDTGRTTSGLYYECHGSRGDVVILIPAFSMDVRMWAPQLAPLAQMARVVAYDTRGHGRSAPPAESYSAVDDLVGLMDELKVTGAHLVGLSNGARIAIDFALVHPMRARSLVLASPGVSGFRGGDFSYMAPVIRAVQAGDLEQAAELWAATPLMHIADDTAAAALVKKISIDNRRLWSYRTNPERPLTPPAIGRLGDIRVPALVITGERDLPDLRRLADSVARGIPGATRAVIPGAGHMVNLAAPNEFTRVVVGFLRSRF